MTAMESGDDIEVMSEEVYARRILPVDPARAIAVKRDVRSVDVATGAAAMVGALHAALRAPGAMFGHIRVLRARDRAGRPFSVGERFQGRYSLAHGSSAARWLSRAAPLRRALGAVE